MRYAYPANVEADGDSFMVTFEGLSGATWGETREKALREGADLPVSALSFSVDDGEATPEPPDAGGRPVVSVTAMEAASLALHDAMVAGGNSNRELARRLGVSEAVSRRLRDPLHESKSDRIEAALRAIGRRMVVEFVEVAA